MPDLASRAAAVTSAGRRNIVGIQLLRAVAATSVVIAHVHYDLIEHLSLRQVLPDLLAWGGAFLRLAVRLVPEYAVLVFALGMMRAWFFPAMTPDIGHAFWLIPALAAAGTLFVIPTAGEAPIIQILQQFGLGGAGAAALLITLPAVSLPSLAMLARALPIRAIAVLGFGTFVFGLLAAAAAAALRL